MTADRDESFLGRWSRLKRADAAAPPTPAPVPAAPVDEPPAPKVELPLPSLDDIKPGADLTAFLRPHVPEALRRAALRKMWSLDPAIRDFREMADYDWDWNTPGGAPGFGPLDPATDLEALARRVIFGSERESDAATAPAEQDEDETALIAGEMASLAGPAAVSQPEIVTPQPTAAPASESLRSNPPPHPDRPRHGGAIPR